MGKGTMKLIDQNTGKMECRVCGRIHFANLQPGGSYFRGSWQCTHGCTWAEWEAMKKEKTKEAKLPPLFKTKKEREEYIKITNPRAKPALLGGPEKKGKK